ncbi:MAG: type II secretion system F family protein [Candidatus Taylorbacteria bacterium]|nr:type II secretion system F family protein [Candidatus Taylorbacteria bacterium]
MSHFTYTAKKTSGETYSAEKDAADRFELYHLVRDRGDELVEFKEKIIGHGLKINVNINFLSRIKMIDKINFARNLGLMLVSGLALSRALSVIERQSKNKMLKAVLKDLMAEINKGSTFSEALAKHPKTFPPIFVSMVHAGEQSGTLSESLSAIANQMENSYILERRVRGALMYPGVILSVMIVIGVLMFIFVVPTLTKIFLELNVPLPFTTRVIIAISDAIQYHGIWVLLLIIFVFIGLWYWSKSISGKKFFHGLLLNLPLIGPLVQEVNSARTARTLSSLILAGVGVVESVSITGTVVQNVYFKEVLVKAEEAIKRGDLMSKVFEDYKELYPIFFSEMLAVGEETGKIGDMLVNVSNYYETDIEQKTKNMSTIIEPVLMVVIGAAVGVFAVSMISPIYSLVGSVK